MALMLKYISSVTKSKIGFGRDFLNKPFYGVKVSKFMKPMEIYLSLS